MKKKIKDYNRSKNKKCKTCKKIINDNSTWCIKCWYKHIKAKIWLCKNCRKSLHNKAIRCQQCYHKWAKKIGLRKGKKNGQYKHGKCINLPNCIDCGKELGSYKAKRCRKHQISRMNKLRWKNKTFRKKMIKILREKALKRLKDPTKNSNWKGGKTKKLRPRLTTEYKTWRNKIFKRDDYTCQRCGKRGGRLEAHHIKSWRNYLKFRFKVNNGQTLCYKCHHKKGYILK